MPSPRRRSRRPQDDPGGTRTRGGAVERGHLHAVRSERGLPRGHGQVNIEVVAVHVETRVGPDPDAQEEVARRTAGAAATLARQPDALAVAHPGGMVTS